MTDYSIGTQILQRILDKFHLEKLSSFKEIKTGLINPVYLVNGKYILRIELHRFEQNPDKLKREFILFQFLPKLGIPTPEVIGFDDSKEIIDTPFIILRFIPGQNLEQMFSGLKRTQQKNISFQMGKLAGRIHSINPEKIHNPLFGSIEQWIAQSTKDFKRYWEVVKDKSYIPSEIKTEIITTFEKFKKLSWDSKGRLIHGDFTPGNIQVSEARITGIFDFEFSGIGDPLWDLQKLPTAFFLGPRFDKNEFLRGYGIGEFNQEEKIRLRTYSYQQGIWEIWATITQFMPYGDEDIKEGQALINSTSKYKLLH